MYSLISPPATWEGSTYPTSSTTLVIVRLVCSFLCTGQSFIFEYMLKILKNQFG